ncbi:transglycosylase SLT domain-containing protein [Pseudoduganella sp. FT55W]|uniref:Transglycosylase SLT domain-containing protein n=1 Tax=Duganella rivi TaxID=2666083 RepID=A0A7X4GT00_9BURK|nr:lytic transglycosylase domain-containing protein [Duganella rivi]MYM69003.1 transglycosylase SLT domain-containing protein [Duganella rivi]
MSLLSRWLGAVALAGLLPAAPLALAGNQKEEALADSVRLALSNAIKDATPPTPTFRNPSDQARYQNWLETMSYRLKRKLPDEQTRKEFLATVWYEARRAGLDPGMVLGLIQVESAYRKYAVSIVGARGYMQVMPFWTNVIGDSNRRALFDMQTNLRYGCAILRMYLDMEAGNLYLALGRYNGSRGKPEYPNAVLAAWNNWK